MLYLASNSQAIGALLAQEDDDGNEQPIYGDQVPQDRKSVFSGYLRIPKAKMVLLNPPNPPSDQVLSYKAFFHQLLLTRKIAQWLVLLSQYDIGLKTPRLLKAKP